MWFVFKWRRWEECFDKADLGCFGIDEVVSTPFLKSECKLPGRWFQMSKQLDLGHQLDLANSVLLIWNQQPLWVDAIPHHISEVVFPSFGRTN